MQATTPTRPPHTDDNEPFIVPARAMGIVYGTQLTDQYYEDLHFPLLDAFSAKLLDKGKTYPDKIILILTNQEAVIDEEDRKIEKSPYWQDTCTFKPIFAEYFQKNFPRVKSIDYLELKPKSKDEGLDNWDKALLLVQQVLSSLDVDKNATVYISHQAGTPAISSAVQFQSLAKFGKNVEFLVSKEFEEELKKRAEIIKSSTYLQGMQVQEAKALLKRYDYLGVKRILKPSLTWAELEALTDFEIDTVNGPTNAQARLRLFGQNESDVRVTLYRDNHAWCPYCQKVWLWLEEKQIPYRIKKVTMFCYGTKESWYKRKVPSGMLPALELDGRMITESDDILMALEQVFGPLVFGMNDSKVLPLRQLERLLFRAWCSWLCYPTRSQGEDQRNKEQFIGVVRKVEEALERTPSPYFLEEFSTADVVFTPYVERMNASLYYYKGYSMREENPGFSAWFDAMESRPPYRGTQSDFHTHVHDLPPQMGGCYENGEPQARINQIRVDNGPWMGLPDVKYPEPENSRTEALQRVIKHRSNIIKVNPADDQLFDEALRCALTYMMTGEISTPPSGSDVALRYLRDRINVPRDLSIYAAKRLREALEETAALVGDRQGSPISVKHRRDQDPVNFASYE